MNTFLNELYCQYGAQNIPDPAEWQFNETYEALYTRLSDDGRAHLRAICRAANTEANRLAERAFRDGLDFALSLVTGVLAER